MGQHATTSERIDELPLLVKCLKQMRVDTIIDSVLGPPHRDDGPFRDNGVEV